MYMLCPCAQPNHLVLAPIVGLTSYGDLIAAPCDPRAFAQLRNHSHNPAPSYVHGAGGINPAPSYVHGAGGINPVGSVESWLHSVAHLAMFWSVGEVSPVGVNVGVLGGLGWVVYATGRSICQGIRRSLGLWWHYKET